ncbi:MAG: MATE family efflux transporter [Clostridiales bacterium]|nr:MATE family efflux transporter [Clostridiales bacterium]
MNTKQELGVKPVGELLLKYSIPATIGMIINALYNVVDRMFIGNIPDIGGIAMSALGIVMPIVSVLLAFAMLLGVGSTSLISIKLGQGEKKEAEKIISNALLLEIIIGIILMVVGLIFIDDILALFNESEGMLIYEKQYINIILLGSVFNIVGFAVNSNMRADGSPVMSAVTMTIGCLLNIVLDALFVNGITIEVSQEAPIFLGFKWGIQGAAIATIISQAVTCIIGIWYFTIGKSQLKIRLKNIKLDKKIVIGILSIGMSPFAMQIASSFVQIVANRALYENGGELAIGAMTTIASIALIFMMPIFGINQGAQPIVGFNYGAKKYDRAKKTVILAILVATIILFVEFLIVQLFPGYLINSFNNDTQLINIALEGIKINLITLPILGISIIGTVYFQAIGKAIVSMILSLLRQVILLIPFYLILPHYFGMQGVWWTQPICDIISTIIVIVVLAREFKMISNKLVVAIDD